MQFKYSAEQIESLKVDTVVCFSHAGTGASGAALKSVDKASGGVIAGMFKSGEFTGKSGQIAQLGKIDGFACSRFLIVGLGSDGSVDPDNYRKAMGTLSRYRALDYSTSAAIVIDGKMNKGAYQAAVEGYLLGSFKHLDYKTTAAAKRESRLKSLTFVVDQKKNLKVLQSAVERGIVIAEGQLLVRQLAQTPSNDLTPALYSRKVSDLAKQHHFSCKVLDEKAIAREKMGGLLGVSKGSAEPPRFMILQYNGGRQGQKPIVLVGKGVTFDAGGISLKPAANMHEMKQDMAGSAVVVATIVTAARLRIKQNLIALIPATENLPSGTATRPGDILRMRKGLTVEIINTDAEGRLILADALDYANEFKPQAVIDIATLTGASLYILGYSGAPILGNDEDLLNRLNDAADETAERVWPLPIWDDHREQMKSPIADLVNSGGKPAGTIAAAAFLENFIGDWPWAHIDIAYVDLEPAGKPYTPKGATGFGCRLLIEVLSNWKKL